MERNSSIYVAGHAGLVGAAICRSLGRKGYSRVITRDRETLDLTDQRQVEDFFSSQKPEVVFLAAAKVGGILANSTYPAEFIHDNLSIALNVITSAHRHGVKKLLNLGSSCIYPKMAPQPIKEDSILTGPLEPTNEPYAVAKIAAIKLCRYYNQQYGTDYLSVMPTNLFGPGDNYNLETSHVLPSLLRKFHLGVLLDNRDFNAIRRDSSRFPVGFGINPFTSDTPDEVIESTLARLGITAGEILLWGTGSPYREFLYVDECADAMVSVMERYAYRDVGEILNIGSGNDIRISEIAIKIAGVTGYKGRIRYDPSKPDGTPRKRLDVSRLTALGWKSCLSLEEGIRLSHDWYLSQVTPA
jgi:GDP-L-fucose synthase